MKAIRLGVAAALFAVSTQAISGTPFQVEKTCPVGGETFTHTETASYSTFGSRPDGKPYGSWIFPMPIAECPENALVIYRNFEEDEIAELTRLVLSDEYQAMREEATYYRASWLAQRMDTDAPLAPIFLLMRAGWQVDEAPEMKARYQREFATRAGEVAIDEGDLDTLFLRFRTANALRETGGFDAALAALDTLPIAALDVTVPERADASYEEVNEAEGRRFLLSQIAPMRRLIERGDMSAEPPSILPDRAAEWRCHQLSEEGADPMPEFCLSPEIQERIAEIEARQRN